MPKSNLTQTNETLILVNPNDEPIGEIEKILAHEYAMLHRAFSVFIFRQRNNKWETLLQQRSVKKYHGGGLWTNTCCGHPHPGENILEAAKKRLFEEMNIDVDLQVVGKFHYVALLDKGMTENEIDHVLIGYFSDDVITVNPDEVDNFEWIDVDVLQKKLHAAPKKYTPWFEEALMIAMQHI